MGDNSPLQSEFTQDSSKSYKNVGCFLLGLFPFILVGGAFVAGTLEEGGNRVAGALWILFSVVVLFAFGHIRYRLSERYRVEERLQDPEPGTEHSMDESTPLKAEERTHFEWETEKSKEASKPDGSVSYSRSMLNYIVMQILILLALAAIAGVLAYFLNPFSRMGNNW